MYGTMFVISYTVPSDVHACKVEGKDVGRCVIKVREAAIAFGTAWQQSALPSNLMAEMKECCLVLFCLVWQTYRVFKRCE